MFIRRYWIPLTVFLVTIVCVCLPPLLTPLSVIVPSVVLDPTEAEMFPPPKAPVQDPTQQGGHWHDGIWHPRAHPSEEQHTPTHPQKLSAVQHAAYIAEWGEPPSPGGAYQHVRDNHGNVLRHYAGTFIDTPLCSQVTPPTFKVAVHVANQDSETRQSILENHIKFEHPGNQTP